MAEQQINNFIITVTLKSGNDIFLNIAAVDEKAARKKYLTTNPYPKSKIKAVKAV
jgi:hypothetical protein